MVRMLCSSSLLLGAMLLSLKVKTVTLGSTAAAEVICACSDPGQVVKSMYSGEVRCAGGVRPSLLIDSSTIDPPTAR